MKYLSTIVAILIGLFLSTQYERIMSSSSAAPAGFTGAPINTGHTCASTNSGCHTPPTGSTYTSNMTYTFYRAGTTTPSTTYQTGQAYDVTVTVTGTGWASPRYGFELCAQRVSSNVFAGAFSLNALSDAAHTQILQSGNYITHKAAITTTNTWHFKWTAPATNVGNISFYLAGLYASGSGTANDLVMTQNFTISFCAATASTQNQTICNGSSFFFNGNFLTTAGTYKDTLVNYRGCDSIITLNLNVKNSSSHTVQHSACGISSYTLNGNTYTASGTYLDTLTNYVGCDSILTLQLNLGFPSSSSFTDSICSNQAYVFNNQSLTAAGSYSDTLTNANGCDSIITLNLLVKPLLTNTINQTICQGSTYNFNGQLISAAGTYLDTLIGLNACDTIVTLNLQVNPSSQDTSYQTIYSNGSYTFNGNSLNTAGFYYDTLTNYLGCDSFLVLNLTVNPITVTNIQQSICSGDTLLFNSQYITQAGSYPDTLTNYLGSDSLINLQVTVLPSSFNALTVNLCNQASYIYLSKSYSTSGVYMDTLMNYQGCDSIITLTLNFYNASNSTFSAQLCSNATLVFNGQTIAAAGSYADTLVNYTGCDSIITLNVSVLPAILTNLSQQICPGSSYLFNAQSLTAAGTYYDTLTSYLGCDSILQLNLQLLSPSSSFITHAICANSSYNFNGTILTNGGTYLDTIPNYVGCDSIITLSLAIQTALYTTLPVSVCNQSSYIYNGTTYTANGSYLDTLQSVGGCDSIITLQLSFNSSSASSFTQTICTNQSFLFNGQQLNASGAYNDTLINYTGCDSIITLNLIVNPISNSGFTAAICNGQSYLFNGINQTNAGTYTDTLINYLGCDSIITLNLVVNLPSNATLQQSICNGQSFSFNNQSLTSSGAYLDTLTNYLGCDSVITLQLTVINPSQHTIQQSVCNLANFNFNGTLLNASGTYYDTLVNYLGCDSIITLQLVFGATTTSTFSQSICANQSYFFNNQTLVTAGTYKDTLVNSLGCDSIITLQLQVRPVTNGQFSQTICAGNTYSFNGNTLTASGNYLDTLVNHFGCDSILTLHLTVLPNSFHTIQQSICNGSSIVFNNHVISASGSYNDTLTNYLGCDSILQLQLTQLPLNSHTISAVICNGGAYLFNNQPLSVAGQYADTLTAYNSCDSIIILNLQVSSGTSSAIAQAICNGSSYFFNGLPRTQAGIYKDTLVNYHGCDSIITLTLTVKNTSTKVLNQTTCSNQAIVFNGHALTTSGVYKDTLVNYLGCDSLITLNLTVYPTSSHTISQTSCQGTPIVFNGHSLTQSGIYLDTLVNYHGCDSILTLNANFIAPVYTNLSTSLCPGSTTLFNGQTISNPGSYFDTLAASSGCDSIVVLQVLLHTVIHTTLNYYMCPGDTYLFNGHVVTGTGIFEDTLVDHFGCDSLITMNMTLIPVDTSITVLPNGLQCAATATSVQWINCTNGQLISGATAAFFSPAIAGNYAAIVSANGCTDTSNCHVYELPNGVVTPILKDFFAVRPTLINDEVLIENNGAHLNFNVTVYNEIGHVQPVSIKMQTASGLVLDTKNWPSGMYIISINNGSNGQFKVFK